MDNVTHTLFALTLARTRLGRGGRGTTAALLLASNAPDIDIVATLGGAANYLAWHRGPTHGPLGVVGLGVVSAALVWVGQRLIRLKPDPTVEGPDPTTDNADRDVHTDVGSGFSRIAKSHLTRDAPFFNLIMISTLGVLLHILMDLPTSYGTRLLSPFSWRWFALDLMPIIDIYLWVIFAAGLLIGSWRSGARQWAAAIALVLMAANYGIRAAAHEHALAAAAERFGPTLPAPCDRSAAFGGLLDSWPRRLGSQEVGARCLQDTAAMPSFGSPFEWRVIAQLPDEYLEIDGDAAAEIPSHWSPLVLEAARTRTAQILLGFSRFPTARVFQEASGGTTVQFSDMRFAMGLDNPQLQARRSALFTVTVTFDPHKEIREEKLGP